MTEAFGRSRLFSHGGARRTRRLPSEVLSEAQCRRVLHASERAQATGNPFNRFITILWQHGGIPEKEATLATQRFLKLAGDWLRLRGEPCRWVYVHEWGPKNGAHVHILLHVPPRLDSDFSLMPLRWTKRILPGGYVKNTLDSKKLPGANAPDNVSREVYRHALWARLHYVLKAAPPALEGKLGLTGCGHAQWGRSSRVYGQRAGSWQVRRKPNQA